jgi:hypothetical protein
MKSSSDSIKNYRLFPYSTHGKLEYSYTPRAQICARFALIPIRVKNKWIWMKSYYSLKLVSSAFCLGGTTSVRYGVYQRSLSIFSFKDILKKDGIIINHYLQKRLTDKKMESWPLAIKNALKHLT